VLFILDRKTTKQPMQMKMFVVNKKFTSSGQKTTRQTDLECASLTEVHEWALTPMEIIWFFFGGGGAPLTICNRFSLTVKHHQGDII
jgi:hypothetical protein